MDWPEKFKLCKLPPKWSKPKKRLTVRNGIIAVAPRLALAELHSAPRGFEAAALQRDPRPGLPQRSPGPGTTVPGGSQNCLKI